MGDGGAKQVFQGRRINAIAFLEVDGSGVLGIEAGVERTLRIFPRSALEEVEFHLSCAGFEPTLESAFFMLSPCRGMSVPGVCD